MRDFDHTVNILVQAYLNDTLIHENCAACAVGNIVCDALKLTPTKLAWYGLAWLDKNGEEFLPEWGKVFMSDSDTKSQSINLSRFTGEAKKQIEATGYNVNELARIEFAFECSPNKGDRMFNGLMAVVDVLADIHGIDLKAKEEAKALFVKA